jgi:hypothetical protein
VRLLDLAAVAFLLLGPLIGGALIALVVDAWLNLRDLRRTGHVSACPAPAWRCTCPPP